MEAQPTREAGVHLDKFQPDTCALSLRSRAEARKRALFFNVTHRVTLQFRSWERFYNIRLETLVHCNTTWSSHTVQFASKRQPAKDSVMGQLSRGLSTGFLSRRFQTPQIVVAFSLSTVIFSAEASQRNHP